MLLHVIGRPARGGRGVAAGKALHVQRDWPAAALRRLVDRPVAAMAGREMLTVDSVPKKQKQAIIARELKKKSSYLRLARLLWQGWRSVK